MRYLTNINSWTPPFNCRQNFTDKNLIQYNNLNFAIFQALAPAKSIFIFYMILSHFFFFLIKSVV